jgi:sec-independent protein translocase protein TatA
MGMSPVQLLIILAIVVVLFGTKRLRNLGTDLGGAIKGFRSSIKEGEHNVKMSQTEDSTTDTQVTAKSKENSK